MIFFFSFLCFYVFFLCFFMEKESYQQLLIDYQTQPSKSKCQTRNCVISQEIYGRNN